MNGHQNLANIRRIVTRLGPDGVSGINPDTKPPQVHHFKALRGMTTSVLWATAPNARSDASNDPVPTLSCLHPQPGGTLLMMLTLPPDSVAAEPGFDPITLAEEYARNLPGLADTFEKDAPGFHTTQTVDYIIVLQGNLTLEMDNEEVELGPQDVVVQNGTRHAWRNRSEAPVILACVLIGARKP